MKRKENGQGFIEYAIILVLIVAVVAVIFVLVRDGLNKPGQSIQSSNPATLRDTLFSVEPRVNGSLSVWMTHDDIGVYCTANPDLQKQINQIFNDPNNEPLVWLNYRSVNVDDKENDLCSREVVGKSATITRYLIIGIRRVHPIPQ